MVIEKDKVVTFHYVLTELDKDMIEDSRDTVPAVFLHGHNAMMPGIEKALAGKSIGGKASVTLPPKEAYGLREEYESRRIPKKYVLTKGKLVAGMAVEINTNNGAKAATLVKVGRYNVDIDPNHPLAGKTLTFDMEVIDVRDATEEELEHGHVHGVGGVEH